MDDSGAEFAAVIQRTPPRLRSRLPEPGDVYGLGDRPPPVRALDQAGAGGGGRQYSAAECRPRGAGKRSYQEARSRRSRRPPRDREHLP